jgi:hypothetical protein
MIYTLLQPRIKTFTAKKALNRNKAHECLNRSSILPAASCCIEGNTCE